MRCKTPCGYSWRLAALGWICFSGLLAPGGLEHTLTAHEGAYAPRVRLAKGRKVSGNLQSPEAFFASTCQGAPMAYPKYAPTLTFGFQLAKMIMTGGCPILSGLCEGWVLGFSFFKLTANNS